MFAHHKSRLMGSHRVGEALRLVPVLLLLFVMLPGVHCDLQAQSSGSLVDKIDSQKEKLRRIRRDIEQHRAKSRELRQEEANIVGQLSHLDKEISLSGRLLRELGERERLLSQHIDSLRIGVAYETQVLAYQRKRLMKRVREMYKRGPNYRLEVMLASPNIQELSRRSKFLQLVAERDAHLVREVKRRKTDLEHQQAVLTEVMADIAALKTTRAQEDIKRREGKTKRVAMLERVRTEKSQHAQAIDELRRSEDKLKDVIGQLERKRLADEKPTGMPSGSFAKLKGSLNRPVKGKITKKFGQDRHPKFGTVTYNNGVNIKARAGSPIRAVAVGKVEFVDWIAGYGNCIILNHSEGYYTLYAHAAEIFVQPGQTVSRSEVIAEVGDSGSLNGYECHFEIRKSKKALDPMTWFKK